MNPQEDAMTLQTANSTADIAPKVEAQTSQPALSSVQRDMPLPIQRAFADMKAQLRTAQEQISWLGESNTRLRNQLVSLAHQGAQTYHDAYHDQLTCLPNRRLLLDRLNQALGQAMRQHKQVVLMLLDLDGFKAVNDKMGHAFGDKLLQAVAERLVACIRGADTACRYGGDEFVVMLPEINGQEHRANVEQKIRTRLVAPYIVNGVDVKIGVSIGSAVFPVEAKSRSELIKQADTAMYRAKAGIPTMINETFSLFANGDETSV